jgi:predicted metal-dependent enzyme (double-stranded beta helix superfamily)
LLQIANTESSDRPRTRREDAVLTVPLSTLVREIAAACADPHESMKGRVVAALGVAAADPALLAAAQCRAQAGSYARHVLYGDPVGHFTILALVWSPGQFSPPHAHHTWCAFAVRTGTLSETLYALDGAHEMALPLRTAERAAGYTCFAQAGLDQIHRLGNAGAEPAVSIHVYGVARERIATHVNRMVEVAPAEE